MAEYDGATEWALEVLAVLHELDPAQSRALRLVYFERLTIDDAAGHPRISARALAAEVASAMAAFALALGKHDADKGLPAAV